MVMGKSPICLEAERYSDVDLCTLRMEAETSQLKMMSHFFVTCPLHAKYAPMTTEMRRVAASTEYSVQPNSSCRSDKEVKGQLGEGEDIFGSNRSYKVLISLVL